MKQYLFILCICYFTACQQTTTPKQAFKTLDFVALNQQIAKHDLSLSPQQIMKMYYSPEVGEGKEIITITEKKVANGLVIVHLIHDYIADDSMKSQQYFLEVAPSEKSWHWQVVDLKSNWRCWEGRGHSDWGIEPCL